MFCSYYLFPKNMQGMLTKHCCFHPKAMIFQKVHITQEDHHHQGLKYAGKGNLLHHLRPFHPAWKQFSL